MDDLKFRLEAHKFKCVKCDLLFMVEKHHAYHVSWYTCPQCNDIPEHMEDIKIVQDGGGN